MNAPETSPAPNSTHSAAAARPMHIPDGVLSPEVCVATGVISAGAVGYSLRQLGRAPSDRTVPLTGMMAALIFAGQMVNFPLGVAPVSGHLMGGVLASAVLGPWAGCIAVTLVLLVQCLLFADGGLLALGANVLNMAVVGALGGYAVYATIRRRFGEANHVSGTIVGAMAAAWISVLAAAALFCLEFALSLPAGRYDLGTIFTMMVTLHAGIGVGEAIITGAVLAFVLTMRPELLKCPAIGMASGQRFGQAAAFGLVVSLAIAAFAAPFASEHADGLAAVHKDQFADRIAEARVLFLEDYNVPSPVAGWESAPLWQKASVSLAGLLGTITVAVAAWMTVRSVQRRSPAIEGAHAK